MLPKGDVVICSVGHYCRCDTSGGHYDKCDTSGVTRCFYALVLFVNLITFTYKYKYKHTRGMILNYYCMM